MSGPTPADVGGGSPSPYTLWQLGSRAARFINRGNVNLNYRQTQAFIAAGGTIQNLGLGGKARQASGYFYGGERITTQNALNIARRQMQAGAPPPRTGPVPQTPPIKPSEPGYQPEPGEIRNPRTRGQTYPRQPPGPKRFPSPPPPPRPPPVTPDTAGRVPIPRPVPVVRGTIVGTVVATAVMNAPQYAEWLYRRWVDTRRTVPGTGGQLNRRGVPSVGLEPITIYSRRLRVPRPPPKRVTAEGRANQNARAQLSRIVIYRSRLPVPKVPARTRAPAPSGTKAPGSMGRLSDWTIPAALGLFGLFNQRGRRRRRDPLTQPQTDGVGSPWPQPQPQAGDAFYFTGAPPPGKTCECKETAPKKRKRRKRRAVCYGGTYRETATGLRKTKRRKVPC